MKTTLVLFSLLSFTTLSVAQTEWVRHTPESSMGIEYLQPGFVNGEAFTMSGSVTLLTGRFALSEGTTLIVELPYMTTAEEYHFTYESYDYWTNTITSTEVIMKQAKSGMGNIGIGMEFESFGSSSTGHIQVYFPTVKNGNSFAGYSGIAGDFPSFERYLPRVWSLLGGFEYHPRLESGLQFSCSVEPLICIPSEDASRKTEVILDYGGGIGYNGRIVKFGVGLGSRWIASEDLFLGTKTSFHHVSAEVSARFGVFEPGITFLRQLDKELNQGVRNTVGIHLRFLF